MNNKEFPQQTNMPYPYPMPYQDNDEIDLVELFRTLWKQKAKIALITAATTLAAGIYAFTAEEVWTSKAVFDAPKLEEIGSYYEVTQQLKRTLQKPTIGAIALIPENITKEVFSEFQKQADSTDLRRDFWISNGYYASLIKNVESEKKKSILLDELINDDVIFVAADEDKKIKFSSISLSTNNSEKSKSLLIEYIDSINNKVWKNKAKELKSILNEEISDLENEQKLIKFRAETDRDNAIQLVRKAKNIAEKANIKDFNITAMQGNANVNSSDMLFFLGTKALDAQIDNLTNKPIILPTRYYEIERILNGLKTLPELNFDNAKSYRYFQEPNKPYSLDKPKRSIIVALGVFIGIIIGMFVVFIGDYFNKKTAIATKEN